MNDNCPLCGMDLQPYGFTRRDEPKPQSSFAAQPCSAGAWWYEHADNPVIVRPLRPYGMRLCAYLNMHWEPVEQLRPGWWIGPLVKPNAEVSRPAPKTETL